jgi:ankyrin repeat protein
MISRGRTPLLIATSQQNWKTAQRLIDAGALVDLADKNGFTPLMATAMQWESRSVSGVACALDESSTGHPVQGW